jgi:hypothetical protein
MKTPAAIASLTVVGSIAFAAGSQVTAGKQLPMMPSGSQAHSMQEEVPQVIPHAQILGGGCQTEPLEWFNPVPRRLSACVGNGNKPNQIGKLPLGAADVNGDGIGEFFDTNWEGSWDLDGSAEYGIAVLSIGAPIGGTLLYRSTTEVQEAQTIVWRNSVLEVAAPVGAEIRRWLGDPWMYGIWVKAKGWRDIDFDGDLDLICEAVLQYATVSGAYGLDLWFENIGYEVAQPPLAADLNNDGIVDGADLGILLSVWGEPN